MEGAKASYFADAEIAMLSECVPTAQLRVVRRGHAARTQLILQQAWEIRRHSPQGHIMAPDIEWRDVPIVEEEPMLTGPGEVNEPQQAACPDIRCDNCRFWGGIRAKGELDQLERINRDYLGMGVKFCGVFRQPEIVAGTWKSAWSQDPQMTDAEAREALIRLDPLWDELFPSEQARIVQLLIERVEIGMAGLNVRLRVDGLAGLAREMAVDVGKAA